MTTGARCVAVTRSRRIAAAVVLFAAAVAGAQRASRDGSDRRPSERLRPGISVLLDEQISAIRGRRIALIVDRGARNERGDRVTDLLATDKRARAARIVVAAAWHPDSWSGESGAVAGSAAGDSHWLARLDAEVDSVVQGAQAIVVDLLDGGMRTGAAPWIMLATLRAGVRHNLAVVVLDRPNPLTGDHAEGPAVDSVQGALDALYGLPLRHGMTIGEMALWFNSAGSLGAALQVIPMRGWRRADWAADNGLPAMLPGGRELTPEQLGMLMALRPLGATNLSVGAGSGRNSVRVAAPWLDAKAAADVLNDRLMPGVRFRAGRAAFTQSAGSSVTLPSVTVEVTDRDRSSGVRTMLAVLSAVRSQRADSLHFDGVRFDQLIGSPTLRALFLAGEDIDTIVDRELPAVVDFRRRVRSVFLYK